MSAVLFVFVSPARSPVLTALAAPAQCSQPGRFAGLWAPSLPAELCSTWSCLARESLAEILLWCRGEPEAARMFFFLVTQRVPGGVCVVKRDALLCQM